MASQRSPRVKSAAVKAVERPQDLRARRARALKALAGNAEWEAMKAARDNITHARGVRECQFLANRYRRMWCAMAEFSVDLDKLFLTLRAKRIPFVLTGAHAIAGWTGRVRATHDVDILVKGGRNYARAVTAIRSLYPNLEVRQFAGVTGFFVPGEKWSVIDVTYPHREDIEETLKTAIWVEERGQKYRVPTLEAALANKYGAMLTPTRDFVKRGQDVQDFAGMVQHSTDEGRQPIDLERLAALGEKVWPGGGGAEIVRLVERVKAGEIPRVDPREGLQR
jgi:hypothetical protein